MRGRDSIWVAGAPPCAPSVHQTRKNWPDLEVIIVGRQSQIKREVTLRATLGDRNQRLTVVGKGSLRGPGSIKFRRFPSDCSIKRHPAGIPLCNRVQMELCRRVQCAHLILYRTTLGCNRDPVTGGCKGRGRAVIEIIAWSVSSPLVL